MYRDEHGEIRDASGAVQEDWGFDYTPPPEPDKKYDPPNTPDTPPPVDPEDPEDPDEPKTGNGFPLPDDRIYSPHYPRVGIDYDYMQDQGPLNIPGGPNWGSGEMQPAVETGRPQPPIYNPFTDYTGPKTMADMGNVGMGGSHFTPEFTQYLGRQGYTIDMTPTHMDLGPQIMNQQGQQVSFNQPKPWQGWGRGLQGLQQGQINYMGSPQFGQGLQGLQQGFGMQSPRPFGTQAFSSGFGGFGQQQGYNR